MLETVWEMTVRYGSCAGLWCFGVGISGFDGDYNVVAPCSACRRARRWTYAGVVSDALAYYGLESKLAFVKHDGSGVSFALRADLRCAVAKGAQEPRGWLMLSPASMM